METCQVLRRYKRFFADVEIDGQVHVAHVPNTGSMKGTLDFPCRGLVSRSDDPKRKLAFTLEFLEFPDGHWVGVNTHKPNRWVENTLRSQMARGEWDFDELKREAAISAATKFDFCLSRTGKVQKLWIEVKNVSMKIENSAAFPDAVTERGRKHLFELAKKCRDGDLAELWFVVQRSDCQSFVVADRIDPLYAEALSGALAAGVKMKIFTLNRELGSLNEQASLPFLGRESQISS